MIVSRMTSQPMIDCLTVCTGSTGGFSFSMGAAIPQVTTSQIASAVHRITADPIPLVIFIFTNIQIILMVGVVEAFSYPVVPGDGFPIQRHGTGAQKFS